jgi:ubiquinone/menaquinone biosynthesis C-methylase UbiE
MPNYGEKKYWDERYASQKGKSFDWLENYESIKPMIKNIGIKKNAYTLNVGCGNSEFSEKMYNDGYKNNYNIDISPTVINDMKERNKGKPGLIYKEMDVRDMKDFKDETFDLVIDKSTIDALLCGDKSFINVALMTKEISRILKTGGYYLIISYGKPEYRLFHLQRKHLAFDIKVIEISSKNKTEKSDIGTHFAYICKKLPEAKNNINKINIVLKEMGNEMINDINSAKKSGVSGVKIQKSINIKQKSNSKPKIKINKKK